MPAEQGPWLEIPEDCLSVCPPACQGYMTGSCWLCRVPGAESHWALAPCLSTEKHPHCPPLAVLEGCCCSLSGARVQERRGESCPSLSLPTTWQDREKAVQPFPLALGHRSPSPCAGQANSLAWLPAGGCKPPGAAHRADFQPHPISG